MEIKKNFTRVSNEAIMKLNGNELKVYCIMQYQYDFFTRNGNNYFRSYEELANDTGFSVRQTKTIVKLLIEGGWVSKSRGGRKGSMNLANIYVVNDSAKNNPVTIEDNNEGFKFNPVTVEGDDERFKNNLNDSAVNCPLTYKNIESDGNDSAEYCTYDSAKNCTYDSAENCTPNNTRTINNTIKYNTRKERKENIYNTSNNLKESETITNFEEDNRDIDYRLFEDYSEGIESLSYCDEESEEYHSEDVSEHKEKENHITSTHVNAEEPETITITSIKLELDKANETEMDKNKTYITSTSAKAEEDMTLQPTLKENNVEINVEPMKQQDSEQFTSTLTCESKEKKSCAKRKESSETFNNYNTQAEYFISINASETTIDVLINDIEDDNRLNDEERDELLDMLNNYKYKYAV